MPAATSDEGEGRNEEEKSRHDLREGQQVAPGDGPDQSRIDSRSGDREKSKGRRQTDQNQSHGDRHAHPPGRRNPGLNRSEQHGETEGDHAARMVLPDVSKGEHVSQEKRRAAKNDGCPAPHHGDRGGTEEQQRARRRDQTPGLLGPCDPGIDAGEIQNVEQREVPGMHAAQTLGEVVGVKESEPVPVNDKRRESEDRDAGGDHDDSAAISPTQESRCRHRGKELENHGPRKGESGDGEATRGAATNRVVENQ